jgi:hypothetical protein
MVVVVVSALKIQCAWKDFNFSFIYEITIDVGCVANKTRVPTTKVKVIVEVQTLSFLYYINIDGGGRVRSKTSVCIWITIDVWCVANKTGVFTTKVKVTLGIQIYKVVVVSAQKLQYAWKDFNFLLHLK